MNYSMWEYEKMKAVVEELIAEIHYVELKVATYTGVRTYPLWRATARVMQYTTTASRRKRNTAMVQAVD
jgi:hypothetical protein